MFCVTGKQKVSFGAVKKFSQVECHEHSVCWSFLITSSYILGKACSTVSVGIPKWTILAPSLLVFIYRRKGP
ncbi:hypothetical protein NC651_009985 [Populus alba x Populus x berolinensis]|nr:hypothetical protein NC651_009985 [Populus alba x Populus x berolinensis]